MQLNLRSIVRNTYNPRHHKITMPCCVNRKHWNIPKMNRSSPQYQTRFDLPANTRVGSMPARRHRQMLFCLFMFRPPSFDGTSPRCYLFVYPVAIDPALIGSIDYLDCFPSALFPAPHVTTPLWKLTNYLDPLSAKSDYSGLCFD